MNRIVVEHLTPTQKRTLMIPDQPREENGWSVWECASSAFDWHYDMTEKAFLYEGKVKVITPVGDVNLRGGDYVTFPKGLDCRWEVQQTVRKVYRFE